MGRVAECGPVDNPKYKYPSQEKALNAIFHRVRELGAKRARWNAYKCPYCNFWHIGHKRKSHAQSKNTKR